VIAPRWVPAPSLQNDPRDMRRKLILLALSVIALPGCATDMLGNEGFEIDWYAEGAGPGATYWERDPLLIESRGFDVSRVGVFSLAELVSSPSLEASGAVIRVIKEGTGQALLDELYLTTPVYLS
jgi:hypothetical protein